MSDQNISESPLASALGIVLAQDQAKSDNEKKRAIALTQSRMDKANSDSDYARETVYSMIQKNSEAIDQLMDIARESMNPRAFEVLAGLIQTNVDAADRLLKIQADSQKVANNQINLERNQAAAANAQPAIGGNTNIYVDKAVFTGTTAELLDMLKTAQPTEMLNQDAIDEDP